MSEIHSFRHLRVVAAVARWGGARGAAERVSLSPPAISQAITAVERAVGEKLFDRTARGMFPTEAGQVFAVRIERAIGYLNTGAQTIAVRKPGSASDAFLSRLATTVQLRAVVGVIEHGGYAPAARHLGVTQPNVHRAIRDLEKMMERRLFQPSRFGASPTPEALVLARYTQLAFREIELGLEELRGLRGLQDGSIRIGALPLLRTRILPIAVTRLVEQYPDAQVTIMDAPYGELLNHLRHGRIDLILGALRDPSPGSDLQQEEFFREPLAIVVRAGHPLLKSRALDVARLVKLEWIAPPGPTPARAHFAEFLRRRGLPLPKRIIECSSFITTRDLLVRGDRVALLSASQIDHEALAGELAIAVAELPGTERPIGVCTRADWSPTRMQAHFLALIREIAHESRPRRSSARTR
ncbi:MAG TPA: LysR family transcriptional regulator [Steroidobacteraceae bacterium]|jgi:DNA-binding transcriptional LysR family regulator|nr:LysR family transcriptional regulator [Steroidobacteraceae bacterium]